MAIQALQDPFPFQ